MNKFRWVWELLPAHFKVVSFSFNFPFNFPDNLKPAITGRRSSTCSFTRRPMIAATAQTKAASGNRGGFFHPLPLSPFNFPDKMRA
jgi:hypothetical protein